MDRVRARAGRRDPPLDLQGVDGALHVEGDNIVQGTLDST
jgi:hypothetical protein